MESRVCDAILAQAQSCELALSAEVQALARGDFAAAADMAEAAERASLLAFAWAAL